MHKAEQVGIFTCQAMFPTPRTMVPYSTAQKVIDVVVSSAAEAELGALYINAKEAAYI